MTLGQIIFIPSFHWEEGSSIHSASLLESSFSGRNSRENASLITTNLTSKSGVNRYLSAFSQNLQFLPPPSMFMQQPCSVTLTVSGS